MVLNGPFYKITHISRAVNQKVFGTTGLPVFPVMKIQKADAEAADNDEKGCNEKTQQEDTRTDLMLGVQQIPGKVAFSMNQQIDTQERQIIKAVEKPDHLPVDAKCEPADQRKHKVYRHPDQNGFSGNFLYGKNPVVRKESHAQTHQHE